MSSISAASPSSLHNAPPQGPVLGHEDVKPNIKDMAGDHLHQKFTIAQEIEEQEHLSTYDEEQGVNAEKAPKVSPQVQPLLTSPSSSPNPLPLPPPLTDAHENNVQHNTSKYQQQLDGTSERPLPLSIPITFPQWFPWTPAQTLKPSSSSSTKHVNGKDTDLESGSDKPPPTSEDFPAEKIVIDARSFSIFRDLKLPQAQWLYQTFFKEAHLRAQSLEKYTQPPNNIPSNMVYSIFTPPWMARLFICDGLYVHMDSPTLHNQYGRVGGKRILLLLAAFYQYEKPFARDALHYLATHFITIQHDPLESSATAAVNGSTDVSDAPPKEPPTGEDFGQNDPATDGVPDMPDQPTNQDIHLSEKNTALPIALPTRITSVSSVSSPNSAPHRQRDTRPTDKQPNQPTDSKTPYTLKRKAVQGPDQEPEQNLTLTSGVIDLTEARDVVRNSEHAAKKGKFAPFESTQPNHYNEQGPFADPAVEHQDS